MDQLAAKYCHANRCKSEMRMLDEKGFINQLRKRNLDKEAIKASVRAVKEFEDFLKEKSRNKDPGSVAVIDLYSYVEQLIKKKKNTVDNLIALWSYSLFKGNKKGAIALIQLVDGHFIMSTLSEKVKQTVNGDKHAKIFEGIEFPPLRTQNKDKPEITKKVMERLESELDRETRRQVLSSGLHAGNEIKESLKPEREEFLKSKGIDDYLKNRHKEYVEELEEHRKKKKLYWTQDVDKSVVEYVRNTPTCQVGKREGDIIYVTKIPYMAIKYLREKDEKKKRYYYCHCPWVREAILTDLKIPTDFCYCSAGFEKSLFDVIFDQPVKADVLQTVLKGDPICKFAIHIPKEYLSQVARTNPKVGQDTI